MFLVLFLDFFCGNWCLIWWLQILGEQAFCFTRFFWILALGETKNKITRVLEPVKSLELGIDGPFPTCLGEAENTKSFIPLSFRRRPTHLSLGQHVAHGLAGAETGRPATPTRPVWPPPNKGCRHAGRACIAGTTDRPMERNSSVRYLHSPVDYYWQRLCPLPVPDEEWIDP